MKTASALLLGAVALTVLPAATASAATNPDNSDSYAYSHPCSMEQLKVEVSGWNAAPSQRLIEVRNLGANSCGLSYFPLVHLGNSHSADQSHNVRPIVPGGLGGPPAYALHAGQSAYAVVDLNPTGATTGTVPGIDEMNVLADGDHMPNADTLNFPLEAGTRVLNPKLGLYRDNIGDAIDSVKDADTPQS
ncbi:DUF4232 domain-containing protein [Streptomyces hesseae]|uniref:DUF4232 domain-containing protein n=1 Tax=Streptomyces hesseae TaxID=3075519 RepID=A0ABU2SVY9_9ACTN|nr:DUF4232 domain-containing protein [Streptomyces sp. DSM 40473]MDT0452025.1 DUF4232 domain-containing protein [Streptomyces sp. DSM 40473]